MSPLGCDGDGGWRKTRVDIHQRLKILLKKKITANLDNVKREGHDKDKPELNKKQRR